MLSLLFPVFFGLYANNNDINVLMPGANLTSAPFEVKLLDAGGGQAQAPAVP